MKSLISMIKAGGQRALVKQLPILILAGTSCWLATPANANDRNWIGAVSANWSDPNNWSPTGTPQNGEDLFFGYPTENDSNRSMTNDLVNLSAHAVYFYNNDYQLSGNALTFASLDNSDYGSTASHTTTINCPLVLQRGGTIRTAQFIHGDITESTADLHVNGAITINAGTLLMEADASDELAGGNGHLYVSGVISGNGNVTVISQKLGGHVSSVEFSGTSGNTFTGTLEIFTYVSWVNGNIVFNKSSGFVVTNRLAVVGGENASIQLSGLNQIGNNGTIEIDAGSQLQLSGNNVTVGDLVFNNDSADAQSSTLDTGSTLVGLNGGITAAVNNNNVHPLIKGQLNLNGFASFDVSGGPSAELDIPARIEGNGFNLVGGGVLRLSGDNTFSGDVMVTAGIILVDSATAFGVASSTYGVHLNGGYLQMNHIAVGAEPLFVDAPCSFYVDELLAVGACSWAGPVTLNTNLRVSAEISMDFWFIRKVCT